MLQPVYIHSNLFLFLSHNNQNFCLSMQVHKCVIVFLFALVLAKVELSASIALKGYVSCLDCNAHYDLSDIKVLVRCSQVKKLATATTSKDGSFETELPTNTPTNCQAKILGAATQLYSSKRTMFSNIVKMSPTESYTVDNALKFYKSCPLVNNDPQCRPHGANLGSSLTVDFPFPPEWGLPPTSFYMPFIPIIGIP